MQIMSHRGYWLKEHEKNTMIAFERSFATGFGTETDIRDCKGDLVISHDVPVGKDFIPLVDFLKLYKESGDGLPLALNVKADGLQGLLCDYLVRYQIHNYFVFDMSAPEMVVYMKKGFKFFTRRSEYETIPVLLDKAQGVWLDAFTEEGFSVESINESLSAGKTVCVVSPELHKRPHLQTWTAIKNIERKENIILCTDFPSESERFFNA